MSSYREDLAYINDRGFSDFTDGASPGVLALLRREGVRRSLVVDLGCGSGRWAEHLGAAGYGVWPEYRNALVPVVSQAFHLFAAPAEFAFRAATGVAKRSADLADHAADAPIPEAAHTSGA